MRRTSILLVALLSIATVASAQIGKRVAIRAGTPEDRAVLEITRATDPAQKLALLEKFLTEFGQGEMALVAYDIYVDHYLQAQDFAKACEYGEKALAMDPDAYSIATRLFRAAQQKGDTARLFDYGFRIGEILQRYKARPAAQGADEATWQATKADTLAENKDDISYIEYALFSTAYQNPNAAEKTAQLERFVAVFPDSQHAANAQSAVALTYQQAQQYDKMQAFIEKTLAAQPSNVSLLVLAADSYSERGVELDKAEEYAGRALKALESTAKPEAMSDEQWAQQQSVQMGLAHSSLGQVHIRKNRNAEAVQAFNTAAPLLKSDAFSYSRNQYRLGFALLNLKRVEEARKALTEAAAADTPYRALAQDKLKTLPAPAPPAKRRRP